MALIKMGSNGDEVRAIQQLLKANQLYLGLVDGDFGGGTYSAVAAWQRNHDLVADGVVGEQTWRAMFGEDMPKPVILNKPLDQRCLALTGSFETGKGYPECFCGISGDFDGQGISLGILQWNFGQDTLQPLLKDMMNDFPDVSKQILGDHFSPLLNVLDTDTSELIGFSQSIQNPETHKVHEPWRGLTRALGRTEEFQEIQTRHAHKLYKKSLRFCAEYELWSERGVALMFDIATQNGSIRNNTKMLIELEINALSINLSEHDREQKKLEIIANKRAEAANVRWIDDVRTRKLCIAQGTGKVHGIQYDLSDQYGIRMKPF